MQSTEILSLYKFSPTGFHIESIKIAPENTQKSGNYWEIHDKNFSENINYCLFCSYFTQLNLL
ncbi:MAG: hypothetical protein A2275_10860 [Bacteroidetes bacterium RIFOXYA12_FULL_35_11]|nr:MAG: hypothetical protein A2X01_10445 [Bacteroidetes bacterium GWF2_35_48]OFY79640.1 MAG: hypothetical protein A2275_10860 [Bacteroidetes bacterium RIFOXYA12_FULL_35_11]OFY92215.1 MAG: hypothetical protein A2309_06105 [Bacteroidetes bacterium RIFOXYB2_FULL_35_7]OFY95189.1 MAG: hypothetical protein A2491_18795 [Bacteroidetes bacterium RIFOXYC12_FULL_35_7]HBX49932.1 hypothetical protein [Bacteroidales bacterium]